MALRDLQQPANTAQNPCRAWCSGPSSTPHRPARWLEWDSGTTDAAWSCLPGPLIAADSNGDSNNSDQRPTPATGNTA